jgi:hypothetical protein
VLPLTSVLAEKRSIVAFPQAGQNLRSMSLHILKGGEALRTGGKREEGEGKEIQKRRESRSRKKTYLKQEWHFKTYCRIFFITKPSTESNLSPICNITLFKVVSWARGEKEREGGSREGRG